MGLSSNDDEVADSARCTRGRTCRALATTRTHSLLSAHHAVPDALAGGYTRALLAATFFVGAVVLIGLRAANTKGEFSGGTSAEITGVEVNGTAQSRALPDGTAELS